MSIVWSQSLFFFSENEKHFYPDTRIENSYKTHTHILLYIQYIYYICNVQIELYISCEAFCIFVRAWLIFFSLDTLKGFRNVHRSNKLWHEFESLYLRCRYTWKACIRFDGYFYICTIYSKLRGHTFHVPCTPVLSCYNFVDVYLLYTLNWNIFT